MIGKVAAPRFNSFVRSFVRMGGGAWIREHYSPSCIRSTATQWLVGAVSGVGSREALFYTYFVYVLTKSSTHRAR